MATAEGGSAADDEALSETIARDLRLRPALVVLSPLSAEERAQVRACGSQRRCLVVFAEQRSASLAVRAAIDRRFSPPLFSVQLLDIAGRASMGEASGEASPAELLDEVRAHLARLFEPLGYPAMCGLSIHTRPPNARIDLPPGTRGGPDEFLVPKGKQSITARLPGYLPARAEIVATSSRAITLDLGLMPEPEQSVPWLAIAVVSALAVGASAVAVVLATRSPGLDGRCLCVTSGVTCARSCP
jgi:hypothetical protein